MSALVPKIKEVITKEKIMYIKIKISGLFNFNFVLFPFKIALRKARITKKSKGLKEKPDKKVYEGRRYWDVPEKSAKKFPGP